MNPILCTDDGTFLEYEVIVQNIFPLQRRLNNVQLQNHGLSIARRLNRVSLSVDLNVIIERSQNNTGNTKQDTLALTNQVTVWQVLATSSSESIGTAIANTISANGNSAFVNCECRRAFMKSIFSFTSPDALSFSKITSSVDTATTSPAITEYSKHPPSEKSSTL